MATFLLTWPPFAKIAQHWPPLYWLGHLSQKSHNIGHLFTDLATFRENRITLATISDLATVGENKSTEATSPDLDLATFSGLATFLRKCVYKGHIFRLGHVFRLGHLFVKIVQRPPYKLGHFLQKSYRGHLITDLATYLRKSGFRAGPGYSYDAA